jgi:hypothetical protein
MSFRFWPYLAMAFVSVNLVASAGVVGIYMRAWRRAPKDHRALPLHVWLVALGHACYSVGALIGLWRASAAIPPNYARIALFITGSVLTLSALWIIGKQGRRVPDRHLEDFPEIPAIVVYEVRQPHEVWIAFMVFAAGLVLLVSGADPDTLEALLPPVALWLYGATFILSGLATCIGVLWRDRLIELAGLVGMIAVFAVAMIGSAAIDSVGIGWADVLFLGSFELATMIRVWQIVQQIRPSGKVSVESRGAQ